MEHHLGLKIDRFGIFLMANEIFANNATTTLGSALSSGATTCTVAAGTGAGFPTLAPGQFFSATLWAAGSDTGVPNEIVYVTARSGDTMTIVRGQEGTSAVAWGVGDTFANYPTAAYFNGLLQAGDLQLQAGNSAVDSGTANAGVITLSPAILSLADILYAPIRVKKISSANTAAYTINVNGLGVKQVTFGANPIQAGQLPASEIFEIAWDGTVFELLSAPAVAVTTGIANNAVTNGKLAQMPAGTVKANITGGTANAADVLLSDLLTALGIGALQANADGYWFFIGTTLVQFGNKSVTNSNFSFPQTWPTGCAGFFATNSDSQGQFVDNAFGYAISTTQYYLATKASDVSNHITNKACSWLAIGN